MLTCQNPKVRYFADMKKFVSLTRNFLCKNAFYSLEEFYNFCKLK